MPENENAKYERVAAIVIIAFIALVSVICLGLFIYNMFVLKLGFYESYKPLWFLAIIGVGMFKPKKKQKPKKRSINFYEDLYLQDIGDAFVSRESSRKNLLKAIREYAEGDRQKAAVMLEKLYKKCRTDEEKLVVLLFTAKNYNAQGMRNKTVSIYEQMLDIDASSIPANNNIGFMYLNENNFDKARMYFENAIRYAPDHPVGYYNMAQLYLITGRLEDSVNYANKALRADPAFEPAVMNLAVAYSALGDDENADKYMQQAVSMGMEYDIIEYEMDHYRDLYLPVEDED